MVLFVVPSHAFRDTLLQRQGLICPASVPLVSATKGIENDSLMLMGEIIADVLGPGAAARARSCRARASPKEVALGMPTNVVVAPTDHALADRRPAVASRPTASACTRATTRSGVEVGGALKNVIAIAAGACDGLGFGHNTRAALITRGLAELTRLAVAKGANPLTLAGLAGMGDLVLTCTGDLSRNRTVGFEMGRGRRSRRAVGARARRRRRADGAQRVPSGPAPGRGAADLLNEVYRVLYEGKAPRQAVQDVLTRPAEEGVGIDTHDPTSLPGVAAVLVAAGGRRAAPGYGQRRAGLRPTGARLRQPAPGYGQPGRATATAPGYANPRLRATRLPAALSVPTRVDEPHRSGNRHAVRA